MDAKFLHTHTLLVKFFVYHHSFFHFNTAVSCFIFIFTETPLHSLENVSVSESNSHGPSGDPGAFNRSGYHSSGALDSSRGWPGMVLFSPTPGTKSLMVYPHV